MGHVLLVEDDRDVHRVLCEALNRAGHDADGVYTKGDAEIALRTKEYHLVIADVRLPDGTGHEVARNAAEAGIRTLLISAYPGELAIHRMVGVEFLAKPFRLERLIAAVNRRMVGEPT